MYRQRLLNALSMSSTLFPAFNHTHQFELSFRPALETTTFFSPDVSAVEKKKEEPSNPEPTFKLPLNPISYPGVTLKIKEAELPVQRPVSFGEADLQVACYSHFKVFFHVVINLIA